MYDSELDEHILTAEIVIFILDNDDKDIRNNKIT